MGRGAGARPRCAGPVNYSTNDVCGSLVEGFEHRPMLMMPCNRPDYDALLAGAGLAPVKDLLAYWIPCVEPAARSASCASATARSSAAASRCATSTCRAGPRSSRTVQRIYNAAWARELGLRPAHRRGVRARREGPRDAPRPAGLLLGREGRRARRVHRSDPRPQRGARRPGRPPLPLRAGSGCSRVARKDPKRARHAAGRRSRGAGKGRRRRDLRQRDAAHEPAAATSTPRPAGSSRTTTACATTSSSRAAGSRSATASTRCRPPAEPGAPGPRCWGPTSRDRPPRAPDRIGCAPRARSPSRTSPTPRAWSCAPSS